MREISVSIEVFAQIWAARQPGEKDESAVLERVFRERQELSTNGESMESVNHDAQQKVPYMAAPATDAIQSKKSSLPVGKLDPPVSGLSSHASWWEVVFAAIENLGSEAQLHYIYREVERICRSTGKRMPKELEATVRGTLEDNCAESHRYKHVRDVFAMTKGRGQGTWGIKKH